MKPHTTHVCLLVHNIFSHVFLYQEWLGYTHTHLITTTHLLKYPTSTYGADYYAGTSLLVSGAYLSFSAPSLRMSRVILILSILAWAYLRIFEPIELVLLLY